jgi:hypothetical protein
MLSLSASKLALDSASCSKVGLGSLEVGGSGAGAGALVVAAVPRTRNRCALDPFAPRVAERREDEGFVAARSPMRSPPGHDLLGQERLPLLRPRRRGGRCPRAGPLLVKCRLESRSAGTSARRSSRFALGKAPAAAREPPPGELHHDVAARLDQIDSPSAKRQDRR